MIIDDFVVGVAVYPVWEKKGKDAKEEEERNLLRGEMQSGLQVAMENNLFVTQLKWMILREIFPLEGRENEG